MRGEFIRSALLLGEKAVDDLATKKVAIFGIGGVGGYVAEALCRTGIERFVLVDDDVVSISNLNRQIIATHSGLGRAKVVLMKERMQDINPDCKIEAIQDVYMPSNKEQFDFQSYDYVVDAVDTVTAKISLAEECAKHGIAIISSMGAGNKMDPTRFEITTIDKTSVCPLARVMRTELRKRGIPPIKVVYSKEECISPKEVSRIMLSHKEGEFAPSHTKRQTPGSLAFVPSAAGLIIASEVVKDLLAKVSDEKDIDI